MPQRSRKLGSASHLWRIAIDFNVPARQRSGAKPTSPATAEKCITEVAAARAI